MRKYFQYSWLSLLLAVNPAYGQDPWDFKVLKAQGSTPSNPSTGYVKIFLDGSNNLKYVNSSGSVTQLAGAHALLSGTHSDTTPATVVRGDLITGQSGPVWARLPISAANRVLRSDGTDAVWGQVGLATDVTGVLPRASGGTGVDASSTAPTFAGLNLTAALVQTGTAAQTVTLQTVEEVVTLSTSGATTDTAANLLPAGAIILALTWRVTTAIAGVDSTGLQVGDSSIPARFGSSTTLTAGGTGTGTDHLRGSVSTDGAGPTQSAAAPVRLTLTGGADNIPSAGAVRISVVYLSLGAPGS